MDTHPTKVKRSNATDRVYQALRDMAIRFELKPGERLTELDIANRFAVSRTPVREALNRLVQEGFMVPEGNRGFAVRLLDPKECFDIYELRLALESTAAALAVERASDEELASLVKFVQQSNRIPSGSNTELVLSVDEQFHDRMAMLSGNSQLAENLRLLSARIHFVRLIDLENKPRSQSLGEHLAIARSLQERNASAVKKALEQHISRRMEDVVEVIRRGIAKIYIADFDRRGPQVARSLS